MAQERKLPFGTIEPNSAKYFYSCMLGGIIGMIMISPRSMSSLLTFLPSIQLVVGSKAFRNSGCIQLTAQRFKDQLTPL